MYPKGQGKANLKKIINALNFCVCPTVQTFPPCQILPLAKKKREKKRQKKQPKALFCRFIGSPWGRETGTTCALRDRMLFVLLLILLFGGKNPNQKTPSTSEQRYQCIEHWCGEKYFKQVLEPVRVFAHTSKVMRLS